MNFDLLKTQTVSSNYCGILIFSTHYGVRDFVPRMASSLRDKRLLQRLGVKIMVLGHLTSCRLLGRH
jgi:hypothetical protein